MVLLLSAMAWIGLSADEKDITYLGGRYCFPFLTIPSIYLISLCSSGFLIRSILELKFLVWLGRVSFPFYLVHHSILCLTRILLTKTGTNPNGWIKNSVAFFFALGVSMILASLLQHLNATVFDLLRSRGTQEIRSRRNSNWKSFIVRAQNRT